MTHQPTKNQFADADNARKEDQKQVMQEILAAEHCPFCPEQLAKYHHQPNLKDGQYWIITPNQWPYDNTQYHWLAILKEHKERFNELTAAESAELFQLLGELEAEYGIVGGGLGIRFGDTDYSAGTVRHLHAQYIIPDILKPDFQPVRLKIGKQWEKRT
jgi:diadenosine tetraphosphate (Ap4A) HIT family hydrolase